MQKPFTKSYTLRLINAGIDDLTPAQQKAIEDHIEQNSVVVKQRGKEQRRTIARTIATPNRLVFGSDSHQLGF
jgi:hypothetical protein